MTSDNIIKASPTKEFFIDMLTRDIPLNRAIIDLIDNSIDGAKGIRKKENYNDLNVEIFVAADKFIIKDNCGGLDRKSTRLNSSHSSESRMPSSA